MSQYINVHAGIVKRDKSSDFESCVIIGDGGPIIDLNGNIIKDVYIARPCFEEGCFKLVK